MKISFSRCCTMNGMSEFPVVWQISGKNFAQEIPVLYTFFSIFLFSWLHEYKASSFAGKFSYSGFIFFGF